MPTVFCYHGGLVFSWDQKLSSSLFSCLDALNTKVVRWGSLKIQSCLLFLRFQCVVIALSNSFCVISILEMSYRAENCVIWKSNSDHIIFRFGPIGFKITVICHLLQPQVTSHYRIYPLCELFLKMWRGNTVFLLEWSRHLQCHLNRCLSEHYYYHNELGWVSPKIWGLK